MIDDCFGDEVRDQVEEAVKRQVKIQGGRPFDWDRFASETAEQVMEEAISEILYYVADDLENMVRNQFDDQIKDLELEN